jgi:flagellar motor switch protein FliM
MSGPVATAQVGRDSLTELFTGSSSFVERLPMLRIALDRAATACTEGLELASEMPLEVTLQGVVSGIAGDLLEAHNGRSAVGVLHAVDWGARLLICAEREAVFAIVESMLGGDGSMPTYSAKRALSKIERRIVGTFFERLGRALSSAFAGIADTEFALESIVDEIDYEAIGRRDDPIVLARFRLDVGDRGGEFVIAVARAALNPLRQALGRVPDKESPTADEQWRHRMQSELTRAHVVVSAVLDERIGELGEVAQFKVGHVLELNATAHGRVRLECNGEQLLWCHLGKSQGKYTLRVDEPIDREQEFFNEILGG